MYHKNPGRAEIEYQCSKKCLPVPIVVCCSGFRWCWPHKDSTSPTNVLYGRICKGAGRKMQNIIPDFLPAFKKPNYLAKQRKQLDIKATSTTRKNRMRVT